MMLLLISDESNIKDLNLELNKLEKQERKELKQNLKVNRPWGYFISIESSANYQVKKLVVYPGQKLSIQKHFKRSEHWVVVRGKAEVYLNEELSVLKENESIYIPQESIHSLANPFDETLEVIETQYGSYLGEDDIVRFSDIYGRD